MNTFTKIVLFTDSDGRAKFREEPIALTEGTQWIGWDPAAKKIRSWTFDDSGGFGEGTWTKDGAKWTIKSSAVLPDGKKAASTNTVARVDADTITWAVTDRTLDGKPLPDIKEVRMRRQASTARNGK